MNRLPLTFILLTIMLDSIGIGLIFPVMPDLLREITGQTLADSAIWGGVLATSFAAMQFLFGPVVGNLSDAYGRRPTLLIALAIMAVDYLVMARADTIWLLLLTRLIAGLTAATHSTATAYMADISAPADRARNFGYIGAAFGVGFVIGPLIGGLLAGIDLRAPFYCAALMAGANLLFGLLVMPETVTEKNRRPFSLARANPLASFRAMGRLPGVGRLLIVLGLYQTALFSYPAIWPFYGQAAFGWDTWMVGVSLAIFGLAMALTQALLVGPTVQRFGARGAVLIGMGVDLVAFAAYGVMTSGTLALIFTPVAAVGGLVMPALQGIMSTEAADDQQGELQGVIASVMAVSTILAPLMMTYTFARFTQEGAALYLPGAPFLLGGLLLLGAIALFAATPSANPTRPDSLT